MTVNQFGHRIRPFFVNKGFWTATFNIKYLVILSRVKVTKKLIPLKKLEVFYKNLNQNEVFQSFMLSQKDISKIPIILLKIKLETLRNDKYHNKNQ